MKLHKSIRKHFCNSCGFLLVLGFRKGGTGAPTVPLLHQKAQSNPAWVLPPTPCSAGNDPHIPTTPGASQRLLNDHVTFWVLKNNNLQFMSMVKYAPVPHVTWLYFKTLRKQDLINRYSNTSHGNLAHQELLSPTFHNKVYLYKKFIFQWFF